MSHGAGHGLVEGENKKIAILISILALFLAIAETLGKSAQTDGISYNVARVHAARRRQRRPRRRHQPGRDRARPAEQDQPDSLQSGAGPAVAPPDSRGGGGLRADPLPDRTRRDGAAHPGRRDLGSVRATGGIDASTTEPSIGGPAVTLRARLIVAFLTLALVPTALLTLFTLDPSAARSRCGTRAAWTGPSSPRSKSATPLARMEATVLAQAED